MKLKWKADQNGDDTEYDGCELSEVETQLLMRLAGKQNHAKLMEQGFTSDEAITILRWWNGI